MGKLGLSASEYDALKMRHRQTRDSRECDRIKAVLLKDHGWSTSRIAQALLLDKGTVNRHIQDFQVSQKLCPENGGSQSKLTSTETDELLSHLSETLYQHNYQIVEYVKNTYGVEYTVPGMHKWLHHHGFVYKQPKGVPYRSDSTQQQAFIEQYETLKEEVGADEPILFMDAVHPTQATKISHGWIKKGVDKPIATNGSRTRLNILGAIELGALD